MTPENEAKGAGCDLNFVGTDGILSIAVIWTSMWVKRYGTCGELAPDLGKNWRPCAYRTPASTAGAL
jgi:hypothetical protein